MQFTDIDDEGLKETYHDANKHSWEKEELEAYDYAAMREQDERGKLALAERRADKKGRLEIAKNLKEMGFAPSDIKKATNLSDEEIEGL